MVATPLLALAALTPLAAAHFGLTQPAWRADTLSDTAPPRYSQWTYPCAGVLSNDTGVNVTDWPLDGGSVVLDLHHDWTYLHVNLGLLLGDDQRATVTSFNMSLTGPTFWNVTGKGTFFIEKVALPAGFTPREGQRASVQVITPGATGSALYNKRNKSDMSNKNPPPSAPTSASRATPPGSPQASTRPRTASPSTRSSPARATPPAPAAAAAARPRARPPARPAPSLPVPAPASASTASSWAPLSAWLASLSTASDGRRHGL
ncbi:hypothetical protein RB598_007323 [Gaeumannomyces tritici]